jgi:hypothetical protein
VQWDGRNIAELELFAGEKFTHATDVDLGDDGAAILGGRYHSWVPLYPGDWVLKASDGSLSKVDDEELQSGFEAAP